MHFLTPLIAREAAYLAILAALGAGPVAFLSERFDTAARIALAPVLGFCAGTCVFTTLLQFTSTRHTHWLVIVLALLSCALAVWRTLRLRRAGLLFSRLRVKDLVSLALVVIAVAAPLTAVLRAHYTVGPTAYYYTDVDNYVSEQDGATNLDLPAARHINDREVSSGQLPQDLQLVGWAEIAELGSNLDAAPLNSNVTGLMGLHADDTNAPFLIVMLLMGGLGAFAGVRYLAQSDSWMAALGGALFGGPMFLELWFDSFQAAIIGIGMTLPVVIVAHSALVTRRRGDLALLAILLAAQLTVYPLYLIIYVVFGGAILVWQAVRMRRSGLSLRPHVKPLVREIVILAVLSLVLDLVGTIRNVRYFHTLLDGGLGLPRVGFKLTPSILPGWIFQTREFWLMPPLSHADAKQWFLGAVLPAVFCGFLVYGLIRRRIGLLLVVLGCICGIVAYYAYASQQACTYCGERDLLPLTPIVAVLIGVGLAAMLASPRVWPKVLAMAGAALIVIAVGQRTRIELTRFDHDSYFLDSGNRALLSKLPRQPGRVEEEGYGLSLYAQAEQPLVYNLIAERTGGDASIILGSDLANGTQYLDYGVIRFTGPQFDPDYRYVLTRLGGVRTDRRTIAVAGGGLALEERTAALDISPYSGLDLGLVGLTTNDGRPFLSPSASPVEFLIAGDGGASTVWAKLTFDAAVPIDVPHQSGVSAKLTGTRLSVCVRATGTAPERFAKVNIKADLTPGPTPDELDPPAVPYEGVTLTAMRAVIGSCRV